MPRLIDIGVNLCDKSFAGDLEAVLTAAKVAGVDRMVITGTSVSGSKASATLASKNAGSLWATAGIHPHHAKDFDDNALEALRNLATRDEVVAIGECGLDYNRNLSPPEDQRRCFEAQVELACALGMPLFLHEREAGADLLEVLSRHRARFSKAVVHCFTGDEATLRAYIDLDLHIGITGWICDERRGLHLRDLVSLIPTNRLMLETDAPYLMPRTIRPKPKSRRNVPEHLPYVLATVAQSLGVTEGELAATTTATAIEFFAL